jgi:hypothetical protein
VLDKEINRRNSGDLAADWLANEIKKNYADPRLLLLLLINGNNNNSGSIQE